MIRTNIILLAVSLSLAAIPQAQAAGCISGAVVGGLAGHLAGHGKLGAVAGCVVGHHEAKKAKQQEERSAGHDPASQGQANPH